MRSGLFRYSTAVGAVALAFALNHIFPATAGNEGHYFLFSVAILASVLFGGLGPGALATVLSALASSYFFLEPIGSLRISSPQASQCLTLFLFEGALIIFVGHLIRTSPRLRARSILTAYGGALLAVVCTVGLKLILFPSEGRKTPFTFFYAAVVASTWYGGIAPGLVTSFMSILAVIAWNLPFYARRCDGPAGQREPLPPCAENGGRRFAGCPCRA